MGTSEWKVKNIMKEHVEPPSVASLSMIGGSLTKIIAERERVIALVKDYADSNEGVLKVNGI
jgi:hypothetical protein